ncbi:MAG TPA: hypothetical protein DHU93_11235, partial [Algoriphagus sp.]|nr:hypothetical protein [Algoriphagus sp.]
MDLTSLRRDSENVLNSAIIDLVDEFKAKEQGEFGTPFSIEKGLKQDGQSATLTLSYSTDPKKSGENIISYSGSESKNGRFTEYSLSISYKSEGKDNRQKFTNTKVSWIASQTSNPIRIQRLFHPLEDIVEKSRSTNFRKSEGAISENIVFTTDLSYKDSQDGLLKFKKT